MIINSFLGCYGCNSISGRCAYSKYSFLQLQIKWLHADEVLSVVCAMVYVAQLTDC